MNPLNLNCLYHFLSPSSFVILTFSQGLKQAVHFLVAELLSSCQSFLKCLPVCLRYVLINCKEPLKTAGLVLVNLKDFFWQHVWSLLPHFLRTIMHLVPRSEICKKNLISERKWKIQKNWKQGWHILYKQK